MRAYKAQGRRAGTERERRDRGGREAREGGQGAGRHEAGRQGTVGDVGEASDGRTVGRRPGPKSSFPKTDVAACQTPPEKGVARRAGRRYRGWASRCIIAMIREVRATPDVCANFCGATHQSAHELLGTQRVRGSSRKHRGYEQSRERLRERILSALFSLLVVVLLTCHHPLHFMISAHL